MAPRLHFLGYLCIMAFLCWSGFQAQNAAGIKSTVHGSANSQLFDHSAAIRNYIIDIIADWAILLYCWWGMLLKGVRIRDFLGYRAINLKTFIKGLPILILFCLIWEAVAFLVSMLLGSNHAASISALLPQSFPEIILWIMLSLMAGYCEEIQSRGYLQGQLFFLSGNIWVAVLGQALVFGMIHSYQGWHQVIVISVLGILYGALAAWRKNLRINMASHALLDIWEGWLRFVVIK